eukprot:1506843-Heterocapsa_arctica.AAC.1
MLPLEDVRPIAGTSLPHSDDHPGGAGPGERRRCGTRGKRTSSPTLARRPRPANSRGGTLWLMAM